MAAVTVVLTFDLDAETLWLARDPESAGRPIWLSQGTYGAREGTPRILRLLERYDLPATFFVPGRVVELHPDAVTSVVEAGHPVEHHSYSHTWVDTLPPEREREEMERGLEILTSFTGRRPRGYRSPAAEFSAITLDLIEEYGFAFSSNMFDADRPYLLRNGERVTGVVELPFAWALDDAPFWLYSSRLPGRTMHAPSTVLETWVREYDGLAREEGTCLVLASHPQVIGRPSRLWVLEQFVQHVLADGRATFSTADALADAARPALEAAHGVTGAAGAASPAATR